MVQRGLINHNVYWVKLFDKYCLIIDDITGQLLEKCFKYKWKITLGVQSNGGLLVPILLRSKQRIIREAVHKCVNCHINKSTRHIKPYDWLKL